jgi:nanoRNase/pAp phosphatase (c-di-AMP/oligoRNAs hydrolase)
MQLFRPIAVAQDAFITRVQQSGVVMGSVVLVDLADVTMDASLKFVAYALFPKCVYSVTVLRSKHHCKVSVGYNPWSGVARRHDIASICRRYDGGGHPVVGAATFPLSDVTRAREVAATIAKELDS